MEESNSSAPAPVPAEQQPVMPATPAPTAPSVEDPGHGLGIASLVCSLLGVSLVGLILGIIAMNKSKAVGKKNSLALAGVIISAVGLVLGLLWFVFVFIMAAADASNL
jgi:hypothetical protein